GAGDEPGEIERRAPLRCDAEAHGAGRAGGDLGPELLRPCAALLDVRAGEDRAELLATIAAEDDPLPGSPRRHVGEEAQGAVPRSVAVGVVEPLEVVEVRQHHRAGPAPPPAEL